MSKLSSDIHQNMRQRSETNSFYSIYEKKDIKWSLKTKKYIKGLSSNKLVMQTTFMSHHSIEIIN